MDNQSSKARMEYYDSMPEDVQSLSRLYGHLVDKLHEGGLTRAMILDKLKQLGRTDG